MPRQKKSSQGAENADATTAPAGAPAPRAAAPVQPVPADVAPAPARDAAGPSAASDPALEGLFGPGGEVGDLGAEGSGVPLAKMEPLALYALRQEIDSLLPPADLQQLDLVEETVRQYQAAKALLASVANNAGVPANQKAQVLNSCAGVLETLAKTQTALYNAEMVKAMEAALERAFAPERQALKEAFYARYDVALRELAARRQEKRERER